MYWICSLFSKKKQPCNKYCKICMKTGNKPNKLGKFVLEDNRILCTGCKNLFTPKELSKIRIINDANNHFISNNNDNTVYI